MPRVLVVEDDAQLVRALKLNLQARSNCEVEEASDGSSALRLAAARRPDAVVLDLGLPDMDGVELIKTIRDWSLVPILVLSARHLSEEKVRVLDAGADDYVTKPFSMDELLARLRAATRRQQPTAESEVPLVVTTDTFTIDLRPRLGQRSARPGGTTRRRPWSGRPGCREGADIRTLPASR